MQKYTVKQKDLIGDIKNFPIEVVQKMVDYQVEQGNRVDVTIFQKDSQSCDNEGGFWWDATKEGDDFWSEVIINHNFDLFFARYPSKQKKQLLLDQRYLRIAKIWSENSYAKRRQVGCLIVKDQMIISDGYNGTPSGFENICEDENNVTKSYVLHAEANAITKLAKSQNSSENATIYITCQPCIECAKLIIQSGIKRVVYSEDYRNTDGVKLLEKAGVEICKIEI